MMIGSDERMEQIALCLYGHLLTGKSFNSRAMKSVFCNIWKSNKGVVICDLDYNLFSFRFFSTADKEYVLNEGPWTFDGKISLPKEQVKASDLPAKSILLLLLNALGTFISCEMAMHRSFYYKVHINGLVWVKIKYVKLPNFCYGCGMLSHVLKGCDTMNSNRAEEDLYSDDAGLSKIMANEEMQLVFGNEASKRKFADAVPQKMVSASFWLSMMGTSLLLLL
ncbi:hypothetical protein Cgig2_030854 [Carnegiea gigantea]|uniref:DUF4283 domain-containing protein n=1 Tax=Carnegiea gigantea TaxID=171969 RepID=A0A9Q1QIT4_9CARY|nr:hypothetical protein Cgig2_030854 [Carnegiea gigantea]